MTPLICSCNEIMFFSIVGTSQGTTTEEYEVPQILHANNGMYVLSIF